MPLRRSSRSFAIVLLLAAALLLYPLSFGPVYWACSDSQGQLQLDQWPVQVLFEIYAPLVWVYQQGPAPLRDTLQWYLTLWGAP